MRQHAITHIEKNSGTGDKDFHTTNMDAITEIRFEVEMVDAPAFSPTKKVRVIKRISRYVNSKYVSVETLTAMRLFLKAAKRHYLLDKPTLRWLEKSYLNGEVLE